MKETGRRSAKSETPLAMISELSVKFQVRLRVVELIGSKSGGSTPSTIFPGPVRFVSQKLFVGLYFSISSGLERLSVIFPFSLSILTCCVISYIVPF